MQILIQLIINALIVYLGAIILPGIHIDDFLTAILVAIMIALFNVSIKPIMTLLTWPITFLTLGFFLFILNGLLILLIAKIVPGFQIDSIWWGILFNIFISIVGSILPFTLGTK